MARPYTGSVECPAIASPASSGIADGRCFVRGTGGSWDYPAAGADVDGAMAIYTENGAPFGEVAFSATPGGLVVLESALAFSAGAELSTTADGRVKAKGAGEIAVARALESAAGAGEFRKCVWTSGRAA